MAKYYKLGKRQQSTLAKLWNKAQPKAFQIMDKNVERAMNYGYEFKDGKQGYGSAQRTLLGMDRGFTALVGKDLKDVKFTTEKGYDMMIDRLNEFLQPDWEQRQKDRMIANISNAVKSVYGESGSIYGEDEDTIIGSTASKRAYYIKQRLSKLSYDELLYITSNTDLLDIYHFYLSSKEDSEEAWSNLLAGITKLRKEYKKLNK